MNSNYYEVIRRERNSTLTPLMRVTIGSSSELCWDVIRTVVGQITTDVTED